MRRFIVAFFVTLLIPFNILKAESTVAYANFGLDIGATGIVTFGTDIFLSGAPNPVGIRFFHGIRWDSSAKYFRDFYVSPAFSTGILQMTRGNVMGDSADELIVFDKAGIAHFYDPTTVTEIGSLFTTTTPEAFTVADLNGDGVVELLTTGSNKVVVHDAQGNQLWLTTGDGGFSVFVAQLDADPAFEIVTASGAVFDWTTKAKQWTLPSSQVGRTLAADVDNDGVNELIVTLGSTAIRCYDIDTQSQKWSVSGFGTALALENISGTSTPELLVGIGSGVGSLRVLNPLTGAQITSVTIGDAGVTDIEVLNIDGGSDLEIIFGAGQSSTGPDHFHMYNAATLQSKYKSTAFSSALFDLQTGDVDSDGHLEMVAVARTAEQEGGGRVVIFDSATFTIENISSQLPPITNVPIFGIQSMLLHDLSSDGKPDFVLATDRTGDGSIEAYRYNSLNKSYVLVWNNATLPTNMPFSALAIDDLDGDGTEEILGGTLVNSTGAIGTSVFAYSRATKQELWHTPQLSVPYFASVWDIKVADVDFDGAKDIVAMVGNERIYILNGVTGALKAIIPGTFTALEIFQGAILTGDSTGKVRGFAWNGTEYFKIAEIPVSTTTVNGVFLGDSGLFGFGAAGRLSGQWVFGQPNFYSTQDYGAGFGRKLIAANINGTLHGVSSGPYAIVGIAP